MDLSKHAGSHELMKMNLDVVHIYYSCSYTSGFSIGMESVFDLG